MDSILKELGVSKETARKVLALWKTAGASDPESLRKVLKKQGADRSLAIATQFAIDASTASVAWYSGLQIANTKSLGSFSLAGEFLIYTLAMWLTISATTDLFTLIAVGRATKMYSDRAEDFLSAVQALAGPDSGLDVIDKAKKAVVTVQVLGALDSILNKLKEEALTADPADFFRDLGGYLVLSKAQSKGFDPDAIGSSAADMAAEFAMFDKNDDGFIDAIEFRQLALKLSIELTAEEAEAAVSVLDKNGDFVVDFQEFVQWWQKTAYPR